MKHLVIGLIVFALLIPTLAFAAPQKATKTGKTLAPISYLTGSKHLVPLKPRYNAPNPWSIRQFNSRKSGGTALDGHIPRR